MPPSYATRCGNVYCEHVAAWLGYTRSLNSRQTRRGTTRRVAERYIVNLALQILTKLVMDQLPDLGLAINMA